MVVSSWKDHFVTIAKTLRIHQWSKNLLLFIPFILAHETLNMSNGVQLILAWFSFSLCASSCYIINDILDVSSDRKHERKQHRPIASGAISITTGVILSIGLLISGLLVVFLFLKQSFVLILCLYVITSLAYSVYLKRLLLVDVLVLSILYAIRIFAGGFLLDIRISNWLLAFSLFFFFSLALLKRYSELKLADKSALRFNDRRYYKYEDLNLLQIMGVGSGLQSVLVLVLYFHSNAVVKYYTHPGWLWLIAPPLLYWINRLWFLSEKGIMKEDPLIFSMKDKTSYLVGLVIVVVFYVCSV